MSGFRLDGSGWRRSLAGESDVVITYDARTRAVSSGGEVIGDDIFDTLNALIAHDPTSVWVGYFGYACRPDLRARPAVGVPDAIWMRVTTDSLVETAGCASEYPLAADRLDPFGSTRGRTQQSVPATYKAAFAEVQRRLNAGDSYEVNLTRRVHLDVSAADPHEIYANLCAINPAPYAAHVWHEGTHVLSASPECFVTIDQGRIRTKPIKGTTPRGSDPQSDTIQRERLVDDARFRAENLMITDLMRNDLSQVSVPGTVNVTGLMQVESYAAVHQLVSTIESELGADISVVDAVRALFPAGSMTGAPKKRTMEIIDAIEATPRGVYSGALGWISGDGCELSVVIRSLIRDPAMGWRVGTGGGITVHSDVTSEWDESEVKLNRLVSALTAPGSV